MKVPEILSLRRKKRCAMIPSNVPRMAGVGSHRLANKPESGSVRMPVRLAQPVPGRTIQQIRPMRQTRANVTNMAASVGARNYAVNYNPLSYIRHITSQFLLDGKRRFVVKSGIMSSLPKASAGTGGMPSGQSSTAASTSTSTSTGSTAVAGSNGGAGLAVVGNVAPTFSPLYQQIKGLITRSLQSGEWKPGEMIPSEVELAARFKVSQGTVRKAIDELSAENLVIRRQGKGTYVATHHEARAQFRFLRLAADSGETHMPDNRIIEVRRLRVPAEIARLLELKSGDPVIFIKRVQAFDGVATILDELWLPGLLFEGLTAERLIEYRGPMYGLFETEFGTRMIRAAEQVRAVGASSDVAMLLEIAPETPLLSVERISYSYDDRPVEVRRSVYLTTSHHYQNALG